MIGSKIINSVSGGGGGAASSIAIGATITNGTAGSILYVAAGPVLAQDNTNFNWKGAGTQVAGQGLTALAGIAVTDVPLALFTRTNNHASVATGFKIVYTDTTSAAGFLPLQVLGGAAGTTNLLKVAKDGTTTIANLAIMDVANTRIEIDLNGSVYGGNNGWEIGGAVGAPFVAMNNVGVYRWSATANRGTAADTALSRIGISVIGVGSGAQGAVDGTLSTKYYLASVGNALTAAGSSRTDALQLAATTNNITTAAGGTGVILPVGVIGMQIVVFNAGANLVQVYASASETIDGVAGSTGVALTNAKRCIYYFTAANTWISGQLGVPSA